MTHYDEGIKTVDEAIEQIEAVAQQIVSENPEVGDDDAHHDVAISYLSQVEPGIAHELARSYLGWDPEDDTDLYERHGVPLTAEISTR